MTHIVLISFLPETSASDRVLVTDTLKDLARTMNYPYGPTFWVVQANKDTRPRQLINGRTIDLVEFAVFNNEADFQQWRACPEHHTAARLMGQFADWVIGDIEVK